MTSLTLNTENIKGPFKLRVVLSVYFLIFTCCALKNLYERSRYPIHPCPGLLATDSKAKVAGL